MNDYGYVVFRRTCWLTYVEFLHSSMLCCITTFMKGYIALAHTSMVMLDCNVPYSYVVTLNGYVALQFIKGYVAL
jgi:hypothetical protein